MSENHSGGFYSIEMVPPVTAAQLHHAVVNALTAAAAAAGLSPGTETLGLGPYATMTGETAARMAAAIAHAFRADEAADEDMLKGLIWRGIFAFSDVVNDRRFTAFGNHETGNFHIGTTLLAAVAETPMPFGGDVPLDAIFGRAHEAIRVDGHLRQTVSLTDRDVRAP